MVISSNPDGELLADVEALEALLDDALEDSFPASDPLAFLRRESAP